MKIRLKGFQELIEWGFESVADRLGIQRRHILFGLFVLFLSSLLTGWYIYEKNWVVMGKRKAGRNEQQMTISLNGEDSAVQEMSKQIRESILDTPMAAAASAQSMAESAASQSAQRSEPQDNSASQSALAGTAASSAPSASGASSSSISPSISPASSSSVMAGQARAESSQSMRMAITQPTTQSAAGRNAARSTPQSTASQSAAASNNISPNSQPASAKSSSLSPSITQSASALIQTSGARAESSQSMSSANAPTAAQQAASGRSSARSTPQATSTQSASANIRASAANAVKASGNTSALSPAATTQASSTSVQASGAKAVASRNMSAASAQSLAQAATGSRGSSRDTPSASVSQGSGSAQASQSATSVSGSSGSSSSYSPTVSDSRAAASGVRSNSARAVAGRNMAAASSQSLAQAATGSHGSSRDTPSASVSQGAGSAQASQSATSVSGSSGSSSSYSPTASDSRAAASGVRSNSARAVAGRNMAGVSVVTVAQASSGARGTARQGPSGRRGKAVGSVKAVNSAAGASEASVAAFRPALSSIRSATPAVRGNGSATAQTSSMPMMSSSPSRLGEAGSNASSQVMLQAGSRALARPVGLRERRSRPRSTYVARPDKAATSVASSVQMAALRNPSAIKSLSPSVTKIRSSVPTVRESRSKPVSSVVDVTPLPSSPRVTLPFPRPKPTLVKSIDPQTNPVKPKPVNPYEKRSVKPELRAAFVKRQGGGPETEAAVALALEWLKKNQSKDGHWNHRSGHITAATGLAMLAYMGWGAKHTESGPYQNVLRKAVEWMLAKERSGDLRYRGDMYDHGIAAIALAEAYNLTRDERLLKPIERMVNFTVKAQNPTTGGWRYRTYRENPSDKGDLSVSGWQLMALKSARLGGINVPEETFEKARVFLTTVMVGDRGYEYQPGRKPSNAMIAEGLFCEQILREGRMNEQMKRSTTLIQSSLPKSSTVDYYYWYYGSLAMRQAQGEAWNAWNDRLKPILLQKQILTGSNRGSWVSQGNKHGYASIAGPVVTTAMAALSLEVYYRYLPLYSPEWSKTEK